MLNDIESKLREIIGELYENKIDIDKISLYDNLYDMGLTSMMFVRIMVCLESAFSLEFDDEDLDINKFQNFHTLINYLDKKLKSLDD